jgi:putative PIN family toxin of toxin-antitoxin system
MAPRVVMDTNILVAGLRSREGSSYRMLSLIDSGKFSLCISVPLILEYEAAAKRQSRATGLISADIDAIIDYICLVAEKHKVYYLWRPFLKDPKDDMVLELAVASNAEAIITYNKADFNGSEQFGIKAITPKELLTQIGEIT